MIISRGDSMLLKQMKYFITVVDYHSFTDAKDKIKM